MSGGRVILENQAAPMVRARAANFTLSTYPTRIPTTTIPTSNDGVIDCTEQPPNWFKIVPFGVGSAFTMRIIGWLEARALPNSQWIPLDLWDGTITLGTTPGTGSVTPNSTIAAGSNGVSLPAAVIALASTAGFASSGTVLIATSIGRIQVAYTGISGNNLTGCNQNTAELNGAGTLSMGAPVVQLNASGSAVASTDYLASNFSATVGNVGVDYNIIVPTANQVGILTVQNKGCRFLEALFAVTSATSANALIGKW